MPFQNHNLLEKDTHLKDENLSEQEYDDDDEDTEHRPVDEYLNQSPSGTRFRDWQDHHDPMDKLFDPAFRED